MERLDEVKPVSQKDWCALGIWDHPIYYHKAMLRLRWYSLWGYSSLRIFGQVIFAVNEASYHQLYRDGMDYNYHYLGQWILKWARIQLCSGIDQLAFYTPKLLDLVDLAHARHPGRQISNQYRSVATAVPVTGRGDFGANAAWKSWSTTWQIAMVLLAVEHCN